ncbi:14845_t:CDS:1, partial [Gigaspora rosea]
MPLTGFGLKLPIYNEEITSAKTLTVGGTATNKVITVEVNFYCQEYD